MHTHFTVSSNSTCAAQINAAKKLRVGYTARSERRLYSMISWTERNLIAGVEDRLIAGWPLQVGSSILPARAERRNNRMCKLGNPSPKSIELPLAPR
jgi:hypothetical protein